MATQGVELWGEKPGALSTLEPLMGPFIAVRLYNPKHTLPVSKGQAGAIPFLQQVVLPIFLIYLISSPDFWHLLSLNEAEEGTGSQECPSWATSMKRKTERKQERKALPPPPTNPVMKTWPTLGSALCPFWGGLQGHRDLVPRY